MNNENINAPQDFEDDVIEIIDETGASMPYKVLADCQWNDKDYILLEPQFDTGEPDEVMIFRVIEEDNGDFNLADLESEEEAKAVFLQFKELLAEDDFVFEE